MSRQKLPGQGKDKVIARLRGQRSTVIETGTQYGFTLASLLATNLFDHLYSVEFADANYKVNVARFQGVPVVKLWKGDSGVLIREMLKESASTPRGAHGAVIWLDAHYTNAAGSPGVTPSEQVPLSRELAHILSDRYASKHMVLMDDLRFWKKSSPNYPSAGSIFSFVCSRAPSAMWHMENDHLRFKIRPR